MSRTPPTSNASSGSGLAKRAESLNLDRAAAATGPFGPRRASRARRAPPGPSTFAMVLLAICFCGLGTPLLELLGQPYTAPGNALLERFHPGTYLTVLLLLR